MAETGDDDMSWDWEDSIWRWGLWETMQPGGFTDSETVECPYCGTMLDVEVSHRYGEDRYVCCSCGGQFEVNWDDGTIKWK